jgi:hypothetical protein
MPRSERSGGSADQDAARILQTNVIDEAHPGKAHSVRKIHVNLTMLLRI